MVKKWIIFLGMICLNVDSFCSSFPLSPFQNAMQIVGFMDHETQSVFEVVAAVLKLGNIEFKPESRVNGLDESKIKDKNGKMRQAMGGKPQICLQAVLILAFL